MARSAISRGVITGLINHKVEFLFTKSKENIGVSHVDWFGGQSVPHATL